MTTSRVWLIGSATTVRRAGRHRDRSTIAGRAAHAPARRRHRPGSAVGSRVREPGPSRVAQTRPGITPSPPDVVPQNGRRAARAPGAGARPERRRAHARSGGTVAAARTPEGPIARRVLLAGVIWRDRSARALRRRLVGQPEDGRIGPGRRRRPRRRSFILTKIRGTTVQAPSATPICQQRVRGSE